MDATAQLVVVVLLASFAIERIVASLNYVLDTAPLLKAGADAKARRIEVRRVLMLIIGGGIAALVVYLADIRVIRLFKAQAAPATLDFWLTWLVLVAGADRIRDLLKDVKAAPQQAVKWEIDGDPKIRTVASPGS